MTTHALTQICPVAKLFSIRWPKINWKMLLFFGFCLVLSLLVFYVFQVQEMIRGGYLIKNYQKQVNMLLEENKNLEVNLAQTSFMENVQKKTEEMSFQKIKTIKYIQILDSSLAKK